MFRIRRWTFQFSRPDLLSRSIAGPVIFHFFNVSVTGRPWCSNTKPIHTRTCRGTRFVGAITIRVLMLKMRGWIPMDSLWGKCLGLCANFDVLLRKFLCGWWVCWWIKFICLDEIFDFSLCHLHKCFLMWCWYLLV